MRHRNKFRHRKDFYERPPPSTTVGRHAASNPYLTGVKGVSGRAPNLRGWVLRFGRAFEDYGVYLLMLQQLYNVVPTLFRLCQLAAKLGLEGVPAALLVKLLTLLSMTLTWLFSLWCLRIRNPQARPLEKVSHVVIPLLSVGWQNVLGWWIFRLSPVPKPFGPPSLLVLFSMLLQLGGVTLVAWGLLQLRANFGVLVVARQAVTTGVYAFCRHPMYYGYAITGLSICLQSRSPGVVLWWLISLLLYAWRARLEEANLAEALPEYAEYLRPGQRPDSSA